MSKKNILEFCSSPDLGGLELSVIDFFDYFKEKNDTYICVRENSKLDSCIDDEAKLLCKNNLFLFRALQLAKIIDEKEIDILHFHWTKDILVAVLAKNMSQKKPKLVQSRHMRMTRFKSDFYHRWLYKNIDVIHAVTRAVQKQLHKFIPNDICPQIFMNYLGVKIPTINTNRMQELKKHYELNGSFVVGIIGRIEDTKGQFLLLKAMKNLAHLDIKCLVVGSFMDNEYKKKLFLLQEKLGIADKVIFTGFTQEVNEHLSLFDIGVLATENETFGLVLIEMMANKIASVAVNNGGPTEIIDDEVDGILIKRDSEILAQKIALLYENSELKNTIAKNGYKKVKNEFNFSKQMDKLYKAIIE